jgi:Icc protein
MPAALRMALVTDIRHGAATGTKVGSQALPLLRRFCDWAEDLGPDLGMNLHRDYAPTPTRLSPYMQKALAEP